MSENPWQTLATRVVYANSWLRLREDTVVRPDGREGIYGVVEMRPSVGIGGDAAQAGDVSRPDGPGPA
jgi:hypothetical protein